MLGRIGGCFARIEPRLQAGKYVRALLSDLPERNGWTITEWIGDRRPDATQRLLNHAVWDTWAAMSEVRRFVVERLDAAAGRTGLRIGALDETGQEKKGRATAGVKRQHMGCAGGVENDINTVHLAYVREGVGHALIGARQWIPAEQVTDPVVAVITGLPLNLAFRTKGELAIDILADAYADGVRLDFVVGDEVYGACLRVKSMSAHTVWPSCGLPWTPMVRASSFMRRIPNPPSTIFPPAAEVRTGRPAPPRSVTARYARSSRTTSTPNQPLLCPETVWSTALLHNSAAIVPASSLRGVPAKSPSTKWRASDTC